MNEESHQYQEESIYVRTIAEKFLTKWYGERCPDFEPNCTNCKRWKLLDDLLQNPFEKS